MVRMANYPVEEKAQRHKFLQETWKKASWFPPHYPWSKTSVSVHTEVLCRFIFLPRPSALRLIRSPQRLRTMTSLPSLRCRRPTESSFPFLVLSQTLGGDEQNYHFLLSTQPTHRIALLDLGAQFRRFPVVPYEWHA